MERAPGVTEAIIEQHQDAALGEALIASGLMAWIGLLGGQIRHTEVRSNPPTAFGTGGQGVPTSGAERREDHE